mgnify:CR=1 FL=1
MPHSRVCDRPPRSRPAFRHVAEAGEQCRAQLDRAGVVALMREAVRGGGDESHGDVTTLFRKQQPPKHAGCPALEVAGRGGSLAPDDDALWRIPELGDVARRQHITRGGRK